jgi:ATP-dependent Clp protease adapter protein ClpS
MIKNVALVFLFSVLFSVGSAFVAPLGSASRVGAQTSVWGVATSRDALVMMPATIEKETIKTSGPAVLDRPQLERKERADSPSKQRTREGGDDWEVRIYNDGMNTREHVARSLVQVTGLTEFLAYQTMMRAHQNGIAVVGQWVFEVAEMYHEGLQTNGIISDLVPVEEES